jgi:hypothetical protein
MGRGGNQRYFAIIYKGYTKSDMCARLFAAFGIVLQLQAQQDPADLLSLVQTQVASSLDRIPRYMCTQTIDRTVYALEPGFSGDCDQGYDDAREAAPPLLNFEMFANLT